MPTVKFIDANNHSYEADGAIGTSVMEVAVSHNVPGIDADCGGP